MSTTRRTNMIMYIEQDSEAERDRQALIDMFKARFEFGVSFRSFTINQIKQERPFIKNVHTRLNELLCLGEIRRYYLDNGKYLYMYKRKMSIKKPATSAG
jgi:hypothetical protein